MSGLEDAMKRSLIILAILAAGDYKKFSMGPFSVSSFRQASTLWRRFTW
jgi:hypothetical protein